MVRKERTKKTVLEFETETPFKTTIAKKTVATGKVTPIRRNRNKATNSRDHR